MYKRWLELFKQIGHKVCESTKKIAGSIESKQELTNGAFGDTTVYIDKLAEDIIINSIKESGLKCTILSEEKGWLKLGSELPIVIIDPIDGSLNAKRLIPYYSVSIALSYGFTTDDISLGYVINLSNKDEFWAIKDSGAYFNNKRIKTASNSLNLAVVEGLKKESSAELLKFIYSNFYKIRQVGSAALDMCYLSLGSFDVFLHIQQSRIIDYAAAKIILEESSGGMFVLGSSNHFKENITIEKGRKFFCLSNKEKIGDFLKQVGWHKK